MGFVAANEPREAGRWRQRTAGSGAPDFGPPIEPGTIKSIVEGHGHVVIASGPKPGWDTLFSNVGAEDAASYAERLNDTMHKAERQFDRKGKGNLNSPAEGGKFGVDQVGSRWVVHGPNGGVVGVYDSEGKANAVANALNEEADAIEKEEDDCVDPWIFGGEHPDADRY
ncbi:MAG: hypothetical protein ACRBI6_17640 [Acidimicrobiales bacterium]